MRKLITLLVFLLLAGLQVAFAQKTVNGVVTTSVDNSPLVGVTIQVKGTNTGVITDADGKYSLSVPDDQATLIFSFIGFEPKEVPVGGQSIIDISLDESVTMVSEIVVTALGIKREEKSLGYAVTVVKTDEMVKNKTLNMMESLEGKCFRFECYHLLLPVPDPVRKYDCVDRLLLHGANNAPSNCN